MSPAPRWYVHVPPATGIIPCGDEEHRLTWSRGKVKLEDHDLGGELAMLVLGGEPCPCLRALRLWADQFGMPPEVFGQMQSWLGDDAPLAPPEIEVHRTLGMLLNWERAWKTDRYMSKHGNLIERVLKPIAQTALKSHLNIARQAFKARVVRNIGINLTPAGRRLELRGQMDRISVAAEATLSTDWVVDVWARGIAVIDDAFVLAVIDPAPENAQDSDGGELVSAVRWVPSPGGSTATPVTSEARLTADDRGRAMLEWTQTPSATRQTPR